MDKEQIIIDGVDVSGCISFDKDNEYNICCYEDTRGDKILFANFCIENKNCYYKQLVSKTQEYEELKDKLKCKIQEYIKLSKEYRRLKDWSHTKAVEIKVNGKIKETNLEEFCRLFQFKEIQARENKLKEWQDFENDLQWKFYENCKEWTEMRDSRDRYRKALEEIEEFCLTYSDNHDAYETVYKYILDVISKAKEEE